MPHPDWNETYQGNFLPWDSGVPESHLVEAVEQGLIPRGRALEVGCGTGTNAVWLAAQGFDVVAIDVAERAIERARAKLRPELAARCRFEARDFLGGAPLDGQFQLVFDRGCFHCFDRKEEQSAYAERVAQRLAPNGVWLSVIGSTEGPAREVGPPRRSALDVVSAAEPFMELVQLRAIVLDPIPGNTSSPKAWIVLWRHRSVPAQPSTRW